MQGINSTQWRATRAAIGEKYKYRCAYCNVRTGKAGTVDHYLPRSLGGSNDRFNLRWSCFRCNNAKADMPPEEWEQRAPVPIENTETKAEKRMAAFAKIYRAQRQMPA